MTLPLRPFRLRREYRTLSREIGMSWMDGVVAVRRALRVGEVRTARIYARNLRELLSTFCEEPR